jgi:hypothetical protein
MENSILNAMKKGTLIMFLLFGSAISLFAGGGWPQKKGKTYLKLSQWWVISDQHYTGNGGIDPQLTRGTFNTSIYAEYGITDRLTGVLYFPFISRSIVNEEVGRTSGNVLTEGEGITGIGDTDLTLKYGLTPNSPWAVSASITLGLPFGNNSGGRDGTLQTGDGEFNQMLQLDVSRGLKIGNAYPYFSINSGLNNRSNGFSDEWRYGMEAGLTVGKLTGIIRFYGVKSLKNGSGPTGEGTSIFANNIEFSSFSPELAFSFSEKFGISATYATAFSGRLIFANPSYSVGIFLKL